MATNVELEAAIEKDPDDEDAYLVYGDWLQTEDDPRGELIAMQAAALRDPTDKQIGHASPSSSRATMKCCSASSAAR